MADVFTFMSTLFHFTDEATEARKNTQNSSKATRLVLVGGKWTQISISQSTPFVFLGTMLFPHCRKGFFVVTASQTSKKKKKKTLKVQQNPSQMEKLQALWWSALPREFPRSGCDI